jgi:hypothetical protein
MTKRINVLRSGVVVKAKCWKRLGEEKHGYSKRILSRDKPVSTVGPVLHQPSLKEEKYCCSKLTRVEL